MAAINSHRKRQVYEDARNPTYITSGNGAPAEDSAPFMGGLYGGGDSYWARTRFFKTLERFTRGGYLNAAKNPYSFRHQHLNKDSELFNFNPAGLTDPNNNRSFLSIDTTYYASSVGRFLAYRRKRAGIIGRDRSMTYKGIRQSNGSNKYMQVMNPSEYIGGNIKSRATAAKWVVGFWRAK